MDACKYNHWVMDGTAIAVQITFIFAFLTIFFFVYVQEVEKTEFRNQLNLIIDNIMSDFDDELTQIIDKQNVLDEDSMIVLVNGIIDMMQEKIAIKSKSTVNDILEQNKTIKMSAFKSLMTVIIITVVIAISVLLLGYCIPITYQIKQAMLVVIFVGMTEFLFLEIIAKRYITADPNKIKRIFAQSIQTWIGQHKR